MCLIEQLTDLNVITSAGLLNKKASTILEKHSSVYQQLMTATSFLPTDTSLRARLFAVRNQITSQPTCQTCGAAMSFNPAKNQFNQFCSNKTSSSCSAGSDDVVKKYKQTMQERYGVDTPAQSEAIMTKRAATVLERYGGPAPMSSEKVREQAKQTMIERYGSIDQVRQYASSKRMDTNMKRYGATTFAGSLVSPDAIQQLSDKDTCKDLLRDYTIAEIAEIVSASEYTVRKYLNEHGLEEQVNKRIQSSPERMIVEHLTSLGIECVSNDRTLIAPKHVDIYIPSCKLAIEYNGIYFHSELQGRGRGYHRDKSKACLAKDVRLIHVLSSEWEANRTLVLSRLANAVGRSAKLFARKCEIRELSTQESRDFFNLSHIQGFVANTVCYGLLEGGVIKAAMSFGVSRFNQKYQWELLRYCSLPGLSVVGGASKLFKHFIRTHKPNGVISYCDLRWGTGNMYTQLGFTYLHTSSPNYYYFKRNADTNKLLSRQVFQKHKLASKLDTFDPDMTEWQNMVNNGYDRIWDCGNSVYGWNQ